MSHATDAYWRWQCSRKVFHYELDFAKPWPRILRSNPKMQRMNVAAWRPWNRNRRPRRGK